MLATSNRQQELHLVAWLAYAHAHPRNDEGPERRNKERREERAIKGREKRKKLERGSFNNQSILNKQVKSLGLREPYL